MERVIVVGAGVGGLAAAVRLQNAGYQVTLYEKEPLVGGKMNRIEEDGFTFDVGPTIVMMPELYREVFELAGRDPDDYIPLTKVEPLMDISFGPDERVRLSNDLADLTSTLEGVSEADAQGYFTYLAKLYGRYRVAKDNFLQRSFRKPTDFYNPKSLVAGLRLHTLGDAYSSVSRYVKDDRLRKALAFQTLYIGISPYEGPSLYMIIPLIELLYGVWYMPGGMYALAEGLRRLFVELGGEVHTSTPVERIVIVDGRARGVMVKGELRLADAVVCNADFPYAMKELVADERTRGKYTPEKIDAMDYSCSCFILYLGLDKRYPAESVHSIRFAPDFRKNLDDIFEDGRFPDDPSFYCYAPCSLDDSLAPEGMQTLYVLVPVPPLAEGGPAWSPDEVARYREQVLDLVESETVYEDVRNHIVCERIYTPRDFEGRFNACRGATFGLRPTLKQSNYWRPHNKADHHCEGLYFCGSSVHPGAGVPIVLLSARLAAEELMTDDGAHASQVRAVAAERAVIAARGEAAERGMAAEELAAESVVAAGVAGVETAVAAGGEGGSR
ncbi:phytoene desaturase family protein [Gordonibacter sp.]|uniref:phytoene desaturase family protein n=1 Tax=Gordonibacter sp. TaxID=1968902 RepID=UPI0025BBE1FE|nr:phytoene desaturase family protein [Gordonibacter sp.]